MNEPFSTQSRPWLTAAIVIGLFYLAGQYIVSSPAREATAPENTRQITVEGKGEVHAMPDIAKVTLGVATGAQSSPEKALDMLSTSFKNIVDSVQEAGVKEEDIKTTNFTINPVYDYTNGRQTIRGYEASESIEIKIRKLDTIGDVLANATAQGVNQAGGVTFDIDKPEELQAKAQSEAISNAKDKAKKLAKELGVSLGEVKSFTTNSQSPYPVPYALEAKAVGQGGDQVTPTIPTGTYDIVSNVSITYELH